MTTREEISPGIFRYACNACGWIVEGAWPELRSGCRCVNPLAPDVRLRQADRPRGVRPTRDAPRKSSVCRYLGAVIARDNGQAVTVKVACHTCDGLQERDYSVFRCELHGRCLPAFNPRREARTAWDQRKPESDLYHLCGRGRCGDFMPVVDLQSPA